MVEDEVVFFWLLGEFVLDFANVSACLEVSRNWGGSSAADETADQKLLPLHRGHACSGGTGELEPTQTSALMFADFLPNEVFVQSLSPFRMNWIFICFIFILVIFKVMFNFLSQ